MPWIDLNQWERASTYAFYRDFEDPWLNLVTDVDVTDAWLWCKREGRRFSLRVWYAVQAAAQAEPAFRMRARAEGVWLHEEVQVGATVLRPDRSFTYAYFRNHPTFDAFEADAIDTIARRMHEPSMVPQDATDAMIYCTAVPWVRFTGLKHPRSGDPKDTVPRVAVGKVTELEGRWRMPISVEAHHALVDGVHVGAFLAAFEKAIRP